MRIYSKTKFHTCEFFFHSYDELDNNFSFKCLNTKKPLKYLTERTDQKLNIRFIKIVKFHEVN